MTRTLLAITTANQLEYTKKCIDSMKDHLSSGIDITIVDDSSKDGTLEYCKAMGINYIAKKKPKGLTHSWNLAYEKFKKEDYNNLIISNNDILVPPGAMEALILSLQSSTIVGPLCNSLGVPYNPKQAVGCFHDLNLDDNSPDNYVEIQKQIAREKELNVPVDRVNGYIFGVNKDVINYEYSPNELFDPNNINIANEDELCDKVLDSKVLVTNAFIFHFKGVSFEAFDVNGRYKLGRNLRWDQVDKIRANRFVLFLYKLKRKLFELFKRNSRI